MIAGHPIIKVEVAEHLAALGAEEDDEGAAIADALMELEAGQGRPFEEFAQEFLERFAAQFSQSPQPLENTYGPACAGA